MFEGDADVGHRHLHLKMTDRVNMRMCGIPEGQFSTYATRLVALGFKVGRVEQMELGVLLKTVDGSREVTFLDTYEMAPETQLYNLVISGSHTYFVDGYAVTGWPNEEDFDYDSWEARKS
jgi:hypothetical protein